MTLEQLAKQGRRKEIFTTAFTINESISHARSETLRNSFVDCEHIKNRNELVNNKLVKQPFRTRSRKARLQRYNKFPDPQAKTTQNF